MNKIRSKAIARAYVKAKFNGAEAGMQVFNTTKRKNAAVMMRKAMQSPQVKESIQEELAKAGLDKEYINKKLYKSIEHNLQYGKASQAVGADLLKTAMKIYNYLPDKTTRVIKEERKVLLDKDYNVLKSELEATVTTMTSLLNDL